MEFSDIGLCALLGNSASCLPRTEHVFDHWKMGWQNPPIRWSELERTLSGRPADPPPGANGGDAPAWSPRRPPYQPPPGGGRRPPARLAVPYAELHCHSNASFLDGGSHPEELAEEATRLGLEALALTDHDGMYGVVRFAEAARALGMPTVFGAELTLDRPPGPGRPTPRQRTGTPDPPGRSPRRRWPAPRVLRAATSAGWRRSTAVTGWS